MDPTLPARCGQVLAAPHHQGNHYCAQSKIVQLGHHKSDREGEDERAVPADTQRSGEPQGGDDRRGAHHDLRRQADRTSHGRLPRGGLRVRNAHEQLASKAGGREETRPLLTAASRRERRSGRVTARRASRSSLCAEAWEYFRTAVRREGQGRPSRRDRLFLTAGRVAHAGSAPPSAVREGGTEEARATIRVARAGAALLGRGA